MNVNEIITDEQIDIAWGNADFGTIYKRGVMERGLLQHMCGYKTGHTIKMILIELGLINSKGTPLKKGKEYLWEAFRNNQSRI
jgi:hypothetical protein